MEITMLFRIQGLEPNNGIQHGNCACRWQQAEKNCVCFSTFEMIRGFSRQPFWMPVNKCWACNFRFGECSNHNAVYTITEHPCQKPFVFQEHTVTRPEHPCPNNNSVRVPRAYGDRSIHAQTIIPFVFQGATSSLWSRTWGRSWHPSADVLKLMFFPCCPSFCH